MSSRLGWKGDCQFSSDSEMETGLQRHFEKNGGVSGDFIGNVHEAMER
jgi:hypothetical protein